MQAESVLRAYREMVEPRLDALLPRAEQTPRGLHEAMRYAVLGGGKRLRPALSLASSVAVGGSPELALDVGCAVEFVHCFSLVHDDLPAIDDDDLRRGRPTLHKRYNEALAVLAGDALFALAFQVVGDLGEESEAARCLASLARASGGQGLVGGEVLDVESEGRAPDVALIELIHRRKTGALVSCACEMGGIVAGASEHEREALARFGMELGLAFQIIDDVLNETASAEQLGKSAGSDRSRKKLTYPAAIGIEGSRKAARACLDRALAALVHLDGKSKPLEEIALSCVERDR